MAHNTIMPRSRLFGKRKDRYLERGASLSILAGYSNYGLGPFISAPGGGDWGPHPSGDCLVAWSPITWILFWAGQEYVSVSRTSLAAPKVAPAAVSSILRNRTSAPIRSRGACSRQPRASAGPASTMSSVAGWSTPIAALA